MAAVAGPDRNRAEPFWLTLLRSFNTSLGTVEGLILPISKERFRLVPCLSGEECMLGGEGSTAQEGPETIRDYPIRDYPIRDYRNTMSLLEVANISNQTLPALHSKKGAPKSIDYMRNLKI